VPYADARMNGATHTLRLRVVLPVLASVVALMVALGAGTAAAHNSLETSSPADGAVVAAGIDRWVLTFAKDVPVESASAEVIGSDGVRTKLAEPTNGASLREVVFVLPAGLTGEVTARWKLIGTDGHVISARVGFTVASASPGTTVAGAVPVQTTVAPAATAPDAPVPSDQLDDTTTPGTVRWFARLAGYLSLITLGGLAVVSTMVARGAHSAGLSSGSAVKVTTAAAVGAAVAPFVTLLVFLDDSTGNGLGGSLLSLGTAFDTTAGSMLLLRTVAATVLLAGLVSRRAGQMLAPGSWQALVLLAVQLVTLAYGGHSRSMAWPLLGIPVDVAHTAASMAWLGGLVVVTFLVAPALDPRGIVDVYERFGSVAQRAVIVILVTGFVQTARLHPGVFTLLTQSHGRWLLLKLVLVAAMLKVGDINRRRLLRSVPLDETAVAARGAVLRRASITEAVTGGLVMAVTAVLVSSSFD